MEILTGVPLEIIVDGNPLLWRALFLTCKGLAATLHCRHPLWERTFLYKIKEGGGSYYAFKDFLFSPLPQVIHRFDKPCWRYVTTVYSRSHPFSGVYIKDAKGDILPVQRIEFGVNEKVSNVIHYWKDNDVNGCVLSVRGVDRKYKIYQRKRILTEIKTNGRYYPACRLLNLPPGVYPRIHARPNLPSGWDILANRDFAVYISVCFALLVLAQFISGVKITAYSKDINYLNILPGVLPSMAFTLLQIWTFGLGAIGDRYDIICCVCAYIIVALTVIYIV